LYKYEKYTTNRKCAVNQQQDEQQVSYTCRNRQV